jgi:cobalt-zinc-cadmium efflux system protein
MSHDQDHSNHDGNMRRVIIALILTGTFMFVEIVGGILSGSLALLADAGHMLTDTMALALAATAFHVSKRPGDKKLTFGYQRFQILAAFVNGLSLLLIVGWILIEAVQRFLSPSEVMGQTMLLVAAAGLVINVAAFAILHGGDKDNLNISGAALHVAGDLLGSVAAIVAALVIIYTGWMAIDPILSVAVAMLILKSAWSLVKRSAHILLEGAPEWLNVEEMQSRIVVAVPGVCGIHHVHVWGLTPQALMLTMHVRLEAEAPNPTELIRDVKNYLRKEHGIGHCTIEIEIDDCADDGLAPVETPHSRDDHGHHH